MLHGPIPAGTWHLVGDGENISRPVDVEFDIVWHPAAGGETVLATVMHSFGAGAGVAFETDVQGSAAAAVAGDQLILRFKTVGPGPGASYTPNGDGALVGARVPNLTLPQ